MPPPRIGGTSGGRSASGPSNAGTGGNIVVSENTTMNLGNISGNAMTFRTVSGGQGHPD